MIAPKESERIPRAALRRLKAPARPYHAKLRDRPATASWNPSPLHEIEAALQKEAGKDAQLQRAVFRDGKAMVASVVLPERVLSPESASRTWQPSVGILASTDSRYALRGFAGGLYRGQPFVLAWMDAEPAGVGSESVRGIVVSAETRYWPKAARVLGRLERRGASLQHADHLAMSMARADILPWHLVPRLKTDGGDRLSLLLSVGEAVRGRRRALDQVETMDRARRFLLGSA